MTYFDQAREELEAEWNAQYDYVAEAHYGLSDTPEMLAFEAADMAAREWIEVQDGIEARGGPAYHLNPWRDERFDEVPF